VATAEVLVHDGDSSCSDGRAVTAGRNVVVEQLSATDAWGRVKTGEAEVLDLRTRAERRRHGAPPGARKVSLLRHAVWPRSGGAVYLCQHANRSKLTGWRGAPEIAEGWTGWTEAGLPIDEP
jgi:rhodanese-related sulfurtransferase